MYPSEAKRPPNNPEPKITKATPKLAPELIPKTKGPANGFLNSVCIKSPEIPSPEPTKIAVIAFDNLKFIIMTFQVSLSEFPNKVETIDFRGILIEPRLIFIKKHITKTKASIVNEL